MGASFEEWWRDLGVITKYVALYVVGVSTAITTGMLSPAHLAVYITGTYGWVQMIYRPLTSALCFGSFSMNWLMTVPTFVSFLSRNENGSFAGKPTDFIWMLMFLAYSMGSLALALGFPWTNFSMLLGLCWVHCKRNPGERSSFFGFEFNSAYFPWVMVAFNFIIAQSLIPELVGIFAGHLYVFFQDVYPVTHGRSLLKTPQWLIRLLARAGVINQTQRMSGFYAQPPLQPRQPHEPLAGGHRWGRGQTLGGQ